MSVSQLPSVTDSFSDRLIRETALSLIREGVVPRSEREDVVQELRLILISALNAYDAEVAAWTTYVKQVVRCAAATICRRQSAECRRPPVDLVSLSITVEDSDGGVIELGAKVSVEEYRAGLGQEFRSDLEKADLAMDLAQVLQALPEELRQIAERLKYQTQGEIVRELGISRSTLARRMIELRNHFETAGLGE